MDYVRPQLFAQLPELAQIEILQMNWKVDSVLHHASLSLLMGIDLSAQ